MDKIDLELSLSTQQASLSKKIPEVSIDLSSIAKGFAVDKLATYLERLGIEHYLVEIGGELKAKGKNIYQQTWSIGIEQPLLAQQQHAQVIVPLDNQAMATSGDYRQFRLDAEGRRVSHLMDPRTFSPIHHHLASITVLHTNAMTADGLATGLFVLGDEKAMEIAEKEQLAIFLIIKTEEGFTTKMSSSFRKLLPKNF